MKATLGHIQVNVRSAAVSLPFWKALLEYLGYRPILEDPHLAGFTGRGADIWLMEADGRHLSAGFHRKRPGLNHLAFRVPAREDVDRFLEEFLRPRGIPALYDTPREFPEYTQGYYAVFFEDPDRLKCEVLWIPERARG